MSHRLVISRKSPTSGVIIPPCGRSTKNAALDTQGNPLPTIEMPVIPSTSAWVWEKQGGPHIAHSPAGASAR